MDLVDSGCRRSKSAYDWSRFGWDSSCDRSWCISLSGACTERRVLEQWCMLYGFAMGLAFGMVNDDDGVVRNVSR